MIVIFQKEVSCSQAVQATYSVSSLVSKEEKSSPGPTLSWKLEISHETFHFVMIIYFGKYFNRVFIARPLA